MYSRRIKAGTVDVSVVIRIVDSTDGTPETGVVFNTTGIDLEYRRELAASVDITEATLAALTTAHADGGFLHIGNGYYRLDLPDAAVAAGATGVLVHGTVTGMVVIGCYIELVAYDPYDTVRLGLTALPNAAAEAAGGLFTRGSGAGQIAQDANGRASVNLVALEGTTIPTNGPIPLWGVIDRGTAQSVTATTIRLRAAFSATDDVMIGKTIWIWSSTNGLHVTAVINDWDNTSKDATVDTMVQTPTGTILYYVFATAPGSVGAPLPASLSATELAKFFTVDTGETYGDAVAGSVVAETADNAGGSALTEGGIADAVWDEALAGHTASGSAGERAGRIPNVAPGGNGGLPTTDANNRIAGIAGTINTLDGLDTAQDSQHSTTQGLVTTVDTVVDAIKLKTDGLPSDPADASVLAGLIATLQAAVDAILADTGTDGVLVAAASKTGYALSSAGVDAILDDAVEGSETLRQAIRLIRAVLLGASPAPVGAVRIYRDAANSKARVTATVSDGDRVIDAVDAT